MSEEERGRVLNEAEKVVYDARKAIRRAYEAGASARTLSRLYAALADAEDARTAARKRVAASYATGASR